MTFTGYFFLRGKQKISDYKITLNPHFAKISLKSLTAKRYYDTSAEVQPIPHNDPASQWCNFSEIEQNQI